MHYLRLIFLFFNLVTWASPSLAEVHKCRDEHGRTVFLDVPCVYDPKSLKNKDTSPLPRAPTDAASKPQGGRNLLTRLSTPVVTQLVLQDMEFANKLDALGQCGLLAPDLTYALSMPEQGRQRVTSGNRSDLCAMIAQEAQLLAKTDLRHAGRVENINVTLSADASQATATYKNIAVVSRQDDPITQSVCEIEASVGIYRGEALFNRLKGTCKVGY